MGNSILGCLLNRLLANGTTRFNDSGTPDNDWTVEGINNWRLHFFFSICVGTKVQMFSDPQELPRFSRCQLCCQLLCNDNACLLKANMSGFDPHLRQSTFLKKRSKRVPYKYCYVVVLGARALEKYNSLQITLGIIGVVAGGIISFNLKPSKTWKTKIQK